VAGWDDTLGYQLYKTDPSGREEGEGGGEGGRDVEEST
jgi:20S proteasome alpha/beta subunit